MIGKRRLTIKIMRMKTMSCYDGHGGRMAVFLLWPHMAEGTGSFLKVFKSHL